MRRRARGPAGKLGAAEYALLVEAFLTLAIGSVAIRALPFRLVGKLASGPVNAPQPEIDARRVLIQRVRWAIDACARRATWRAVCFQRALAAQLMLRRRGLNSTLFYGARSDSALGVDAHVWVRDGQIDVVGCEETERYAVLATFPSQSPS